MGSLRKCDHHAKAGRNIGALTPENCLGSRRPGKIFRGWNFTYVCGLAKETLSIFFYPSSTTGSYFLFSYRL